jgi:hypothetical protein
LTVKTMVGEQVLELRRYDSPVAEAWPEYIACTSRGAYALRLGGFSAVDLSADGYVQLLPASFRGRRICEVRSAGDELAILLEDGSLIHYYTVYDFESDTWPVVTFPNREEAAGWRLEYESLPIIASAER